MATSLEDLLQRVGTPATFAAEGRLPISDLGIEVAGVGRLTLPVTPAAVRKLSGVARPSPFGLGEKTVFDPAVRRSWEIPPDQVRIRGRTWDAALTEHLRKVAVELGLHPGVTVEATVDKLLLYEKGDFFKPHQDSERDDDMVASLVVVLPSECRGGELIVEHRGETRTFGRGARPSNRDASLVVFYADCRHEVRPVTSGARVTLTYQLRLRGHRSASIGEPPADLASALEESVREHFSRPVRDRSSQAPRRPAERLVVLLDHEYTQRSLAWGRLKGADRARVAALTAAAKRLDCERFLALAEVHETWSCLDDEPYFGRGRGRFGRDSWRGPDVDESYEDDDDASDRAAAPKRRAREYELLDLEDWSIYLHHWVDAAGKHSTGLDVPVEDHELVEAKPSRELEPFRVEHEGYQGNYGNTVDRWYHRAALLMWPRENTFLLRAKADPGWAVDQLLAIPPGGSAELEAKVTSILPSWRSRAGDVVRSRFAARVLKVATRIEQPSLALEWLAPVGSAGLETAGARRDFLALVDRHGLEWAQKLVGGWRGDDYGVGSRDSAAMPSLCEVLAESGSPVARALAVWWATREIGKHVAGHLQGGARSAQWLELDAQEFPPTRLATQFAAATAIGETSLVDGAIQRLLEAPRIATLPFLVALLRACTEGSPALRDHIAGSVLRKVCLERLAGLASRPSRAPDDWSIDFALRCSCEDCKALGGFLRSNLTALDLPLGKERREHLHVLIDNAGLPVLHATRREGRPYTLQLRKDRNLFRRETEHRERAETILRELDAPPAVAVRGGSRKPRPERQTVRKKARP